MAPLRRWTHAVGQVLSGVCGEADAEGTLDRFWAVDNNLNIANMGWDDFAAALDEDGVYHGRRE